MSREGRQTPTVNTRVSPNAEEKWSPSSMKTPLQIINEYGIKSGNPPVFVMEKAEGMAHDPSFVFSVTIGDVSCTGEGPSKKAAKHKAAEAAMKVLNIDMDAENLLAQSDNNNVLLEMDNNPNSVGILQELALHRGWHLPEYRVLVETGPPHRKEFTVSCSIESLSEKAVGSSKKSAKKAAADRMVAKLQSLSGSTTITWNPAAKVPVEKLKSSTAEKISSLRRIQLSVPNTNYIQMMLELSKEQGFEVTYFNIDELTVNGQFQCLAELSTSPVIVCHGMGPSCSNAHNDAAHNALQYIKIMVSKK